MECIDSIELKNFNNIKRKNFIDVIKNDVKYTNINKIITGDGDPINIMIEENILSKIEEHYNAKTKLVEYIKIKENETIIFVGDIHGDYNSMINAFSLFDHKINHIIFLGDIVDRGPKSVECIITLYLYKIMFPNKVHIIRGNHECETVSKNYSFYTELKYKNKSNILVDTLFNDICKTFSHLPIISILSNEKNIFRICCVHGCIGKNTNLNIIENLDHSMKNFINECWNDPHPLQDLAEFDEPSERGCGFYITQKSLLEWMKQNHINCIFRSHEVVDAGFKLGFANSMHLIHIFSQPNYCGFIKNKASIATVNDCFTKCEIHVYDEYSHTKTL
jgi:serine/threonine-protein phosphatase 5